MTIAGDADRDLMLLCHRIPYPPDKGDKIRSYRWMRALAGGHRLHLAAFVDDPRDWQHAPRLREFCADVCLLPLNSGRARLRSLSALLTGSPLTTAYYRDARMAAWVNDLVQRRRVTCAVVYSSAMAQYVAGFRAADLRRVIDFVDVDSDKWRQYAASRRGPSAWVYGREAKRLLNYDAAIAQEFDLSLFVSRAEARFFQSVAGLETEPGFVANGVDHGFFRPDPDRTSPYPRGRPAVVFTGAMDYWANIDAVQWFAERAWPAIRARLPDALFYVVGSRPGKTIKALSGGGIVVTGRVPDVRPYLQHAAAVVAPVRIARGIQNKVLEGMAMARPVVLSAAALEGIDAEDGVHVLLAGDAEDFTERVCEVLLGRHAEIGASARDFVERYFNWTTAAERFLDLVRGMSPDAF